MKEELSTLCCCFCLLFFLFNFDAQKPTVLNIGNVSPNVSITSFCLLPGTATLRQSHTRDGIIWTLAPRRKLWNCVGGDMLSESIMSNLKNAILFPQAECEIQYLLLKLWSSRDRVWTASSLRRRRIDTPVCRVLTTCELGQSPASQIKSKLVYLCKDAAYGLETYTHARSPRHSSYLLAWVLLDSDTRRYMHN